MVGQLRQLNTIAIQVNELNTLGTNLGYTIIQYRFQMGQIFASRIHELQSAIIQQIGVALTRGFHHQLRNSFN